VAKKKVMKKAPAKKTSSKRKKGEIVGSARRIREMAKGVEPDITKIAKGFSDDYPADTNQTKMDTGSIVLNEMLKGGMAAGHFYEFVSKSGLGKTTMSLTVAKAFIKQGKTVVFLDFEKALNDDLIEGCGLMPYLGKSFIVHKAATFADAEQLLETYCLHPQVALVIVDSITAVLPSKVMEMAIEDIEPALRARMESQFLAKYKTFASATNTSFIFINQMRMKLKFSGISKQDAASGNAMEHYSDVRFIIERAEKILDSEGTPVGHDLDLVTSKNKFGPPFVTYVASIYFGKGISNVRAMARIMEATEMVTKSGSWFDIKVGDLTKKVQGFNMLEEFIRENGDRIYKYLIDNSYLGSWK